MNWTLFQNSIEVGILATLLALVFGLAAALWLTGLEQRWQQRLLLLSTVALALPPFLVTNCWLHYLGEAGAWRGWLPFNIYSLGGTVWILALMTWPITLLAAWSSWQRIGAAQLDSDPALRGRLLFRWLLWPMARAAVVQAGVLTLALVLNNFAVPAILQVKVFPAVMWVEFSSNFSYAKALQLCLPLLIVPLLVFLFLRQGEWHWPRENPATAQAFRRQLGTVLSRCCGGVTLLVLLVSVGLPLMHILGTKATWAELPAVFRAEPTLAFRTMAVAGVTALICTGIGLLTWRTRLGAVLWLPFFLPGIVTGIALIYLFNRPVLDAVYHSLWIVVCGWCIRYAALAGQTVGNAMRGLDQTLIEAARLEGARRFGLFRHAVWPQIAPQVLAMGYLTYLLCLWDVETIVLISPPGGETLALRIFNLLHYGHIAQVNALCLLLLLTAIVPWLVWRAARWCRQIKTLPMPGFATIPTLKSSILCLMVGCLALTGCGEKPGGLQSRFFDHVEVIGTRGTASGQFNKPRSVAVDREDNLYVVDMTGRVQKFSAQGIFLMSWQMPQTELGKPKGMSCDAQGNVIVLEPHYQRVNHFTPQGVLVQQWGIRGTNAGQLALPRSVAVNSRGEIFVSEYTCVDRVQSFSPDGQHQHLLFGRPGRADGEFNRAEGMGIDRADRVYVADSCNHRIEVFSKEGKFLAKYGEPGPAPGQLSYPYDVRVDGDGFQYVCEFGNSRIQIFDAQNRPVEVLGGIGAEPGRFSNPWGIALDSRGNLYVADGANHRVQKFYRKRSVKS